MKRLALFTMAAIGLVGAGLVVNTHLMFGIVLWVLSALVLLCAVFPPEVER